MANGLASGQRTGQGVVADDSGAAASVAVAGRRRDTAVAIVVARGEWRRATARDPRRAAGRGLAECERVLARAAATSVALVGLAALAPPAVAEPTGGSLIAIGSGPAPRLRGGLAARARIDGGAGRIRMGGWFGRLGVELVVSVAGVALDDGPGDAMVLSGPALTYYAVQTRWLQLGARAGLLAGSISGTRTVAVPCEGPRPCTEETSVDRGGFALDLGVTAQLTLGARRGSRFVLWADAGLQHGRFQLADAVVDSQVAAVTFGLGHAHAF